MNRCLEYEDWSLNLITEFKSYVCKYYFLKIFFWIKIATLAQIVSVSSNTLENSIWYLIKTSFVEEVQLPWWWYLVIKKLTMLVWSRVSVHDHTTVCRYLSQYKIMSNMSGSLIFFKYTSVFQSHYHQFTVSYISSKLTQIHVSECTWTFPYAYHLYPVKC